MAMVCLCAVGSADSWAQDVAIEARIVWGGGPARQFAGSIRITDGSLEVVRNLAVQDDAAAAVVPKDASELTVRPHSLGTFGGVDLRLKGKLDSQLQIQLTEPGSTATSQPAQVTLKQLLSGREVFPIDARGSKLAIERPLYDRLRAKLNQGQAILYAGDIANLVVEGHRTGLPAGDYRVHVRMFAIDDDRPITQLHQDIVVDDQGSFPNTLFSSITPPTQPGVYYFDVTVQRRRLINNLMSNAALPVRRVEFVVAPSTQNPPADQNIAFGSWTTLAQVYPAGVSWWDSLGTFRIPTVKTITPLVSANARPLGSGEHQRRLIGDRECMVLAPNAWQGFPLSTEHVGLPHRVSVQVPADASQKLVFSVHERSQASDAPALRLDSGMLVEVSHSSSADFVTHHFLFWPKQTHAYLLVLNADTQRPATLSEINLEVASEGLVQSNSQPTVETERDNSQPTKRIASMYLDKPLLAENFCAMRRVDASRELDGWQTVWQSADRLAEYTAWSGHNTATITVATQGGAIYPSQTWTPSPKFDSGTFFSDGSSPEIKDWVELICCQFDQRGLKLVLALDLEGPLLELEKATQEPAPINSKKLPSSRYQVDLTGREARLNTTDVSSTDDPKHTLYNPLDERVQTALTKIVTELATRYGKHPCLAGIQINLSERSHFNFAGDVWGYDDQALARFQRSLGSELPKDDDERHRLLTSTLRLSYLNDRASQLSAYYVKLAKEIRTSNANVQLIINPTKLVAMPPAADNYLMAASQALSPSELLLGAGIDSRVLATADNIVMLRPEADSPLRAPASRAWSYRLASDAQLDSGFAGAKTGAIIQQLPTSFRLSDFDKVNPYGNARTRTWLFPHALPAGAAARRSLTHRLFQADAQWLASGGWMVPIGQEEAVRPLLKAYERFPAVVMSELKPHSVSSTLKIRRTEHAGKTWLQFINDASWTEQATIEFHCPKETEAVVFGDQNSLLEDARQSVAPGKLNRLALTIPAYGLTGVCIDSATLELVNIASRPPSDLADKLDRRLSELQSLIDRAGELNQQQTLGLRGGDFEVWEQNGMPQGWTTSNNPNTSVTQEFELPRSGAACIRLENRSTNGTAWIQSDRIAIPATGRLALEVWARTAPGPTQPSVRLSLVGRYRDGKRFQRWHEFSSDSDQTSRTASKSTNKAGRLPIDWGNRPLVLLVPDLPNDELVELKVAIDVVDQGTLWVDDVRVYGMYLHPEEKVHLSGQMFMARQQMRQGNFALADQMLGSFWSNFLSTYLPSASATGTAASTPAKEARLPSGPISGPTPAWRKSNAPRLNQWQENLRGRWQR